MKILVSIGSLGVGGAEKQAVWLANELSVINDVTLLTFSGGKRESDLSERVKRIQLLQDDGVVSGSETSNNSVQLKTAPEFTKPTSLVTLLKVNIYPSVKSYFFVRKLVSLRSWYANCGRIHQIKSLAAYQVTNLRLFFKTYKSISKFKPDFVITFLFHDTLMVGLSSILRLKRPVLIVGRRSPIGYGGRERSLILNLLLKFINKKADYAVTNSEANIPRAISDGIDISKVVHIGNFVAVNPNQFRNGPTNMLTLLCIANFFEYKNHNNLVRALGQIKEDVKITFLGDGPLKPEIIQLANSLEIDAQFLSHKEQIAVPSYEIDFLVLPSTSEGSSNALLEALAAGYPCIATNVGSVAELIGLGAPLIVASGFDQDSLLEAVKMALREKSQYMHRGAKFQEIMNSNYGKEIIFRKWMSLLSN